MADNDETKEVHPFDLPYLRKLIEDLDGEVKARGEVMGLMETHMATTNLILQQLKEKDVSLTKTQEEHAFRIHEMELAQASCEAPTAIKQHGRELKKLNAFMDMVKQGSGGNIDTNMVNVHEQRMQAAAEAAIRDSIPMKHHMMKMLPWLIIACIFCIVVTTLIMARVATGKEVELPTPPSIPAIEIKANSSSQGVKR